VTSQRDDRRAAAAHDAPSAPRPGTRCLLHDLGCPRETALRSLNSACESTPSLRCRNERAGSGPTGAPSSSHHR
jgi:hypothetical protein